MKIIGSLLLFLVGFVLIARLHGSTLSKTAIKLNNHHSNKQLFDIIDEVNKACPDITYVYDLGLKSANNVPLRVIVFSDQPEEHELLEPEFKYVGNMHGNEVVGRELIIELMYQLCHAYNNKVANVRELIESTRIHLLATMNPDGWQIAVDNEFKNLPSGVKFDNVEKMLRERGVQDWMNGRANANGVDLNRNFPDLDEYEYKYNAERKNRFDHLLEESTKEIMIDQVDCRNQPYQNETLAVASWIIKTPFVLSANLHGGDLVVNYPYDDSNNHVNKYAATPDDELFKNMAYFYAREHANMASEDRKPCDMIDNDFKDGITNGADWYPVCGGMQDYNYLSSNCFELTIEMGCNKFPPGKELKKYWEDNADSFYEYIWLSHIGVKGLVLDEFELPVSGARVVVEKWDKSKEKFNMIKHNVLTTYNGEYWRLLTPGTYRMWAESAIGARSKNVTVDVVYQPYQPAKVVNLRIKPDLNLGNEKKYLEMLRQVLESDNFGFE